MISICVISCGSKKVWSRSNAAKTYPAKEAYIGPLFTKSRQFAERFFPGRWFILSDKYGLISPEQQISNYDVSPADIVNDTGFFSTVTTQISRLNLHPSKIYTTAGAIHSDIIKRSFPEAEIINPIEGLPPGKRMQKLNTILAGGAR